MMAASSFSSYEKRGGAVYEKIDRISREIFNLFSRKFCFITMVNYCKPQSPTFFLKSLNGLWLQLAVNYHIKVINAGQDDFLRLLPIYLFF